MPELDIPRKTHMIFHRETTQTCFSAIITGYGVITHDDIKNDVMTL